MLAKVDCYMWEGGRGVWELITRRNVLTQCTYGFSQWYFDNDPDGTKKLYVVAVSSR